MAEVDQLIVTVPPAMRAALPACVPQLALRAFVTHDPPAQQLGSGGGTAYALHAAWSASGNGSFADWLGQGCRILVHGSGESRRLPAYAAAGKLCMPMPALRWARGQRLGQALLDLNEPFLREVVQAAGESSRLLIASGDVLLRSNARLPQLPDADVVILGMWADPEEAQHYGVVFVDPHDPTRLQTFLQKPSPDEIRERSRSSAFMVDIGAWLLSERAIACLLAKCGWNSKQVKFNQGDVPDHYDLYGQWALSLGEHPRVPDAAISGLSVAIVPLREGEFYHFGVTRDIIESTYRLQSLVRDQTALGVVPSLAQPRQFVQDSLCGVPVRLEQNERLWIDNSYIPATWQLAQRHVLIGVPQNNWQLELTAGVCLDFVPIDDEAWAIRAYGFDDRFRGAIGDSATSWLDAPAAEWFAGRRISWNDAGIAPNVDLQLAPLFPVVSNKELVGDFVQWLVAPQPLFDAEWRQRWLNAPRLSARELAHRANLSRSYNQRRELRAATMPLMAQHGAQSVFYKLDLADTAAQFAATSCDLPAPLDGDADLMLAVNSRMFRGEVQRLRGHHDWQAEESASFGLLAQSLIAPFRREVVVPEFRLADDQIVWGRSPIRIDLAGGWTDTPPYCLQNGGTVVNIALDLNGQPPIQVFARRSTERVLTIRSIDLGISETLATYDDVASYCVLGSGFSVAKAALALAGFHPDFCGERYRTLGDQLADFGGGVDLSMLSAVPKGSGLGASSILSATVLGTLSELCGHGWDPHQVAARVSAVEQMLGSGGGWQDQYGGLLAGAKLLQSQPGLVQNVTARWLPGEFFASPEYTARSLLYYTGITRVAHGVLREIVRGMFLNDRDRLEMLDAIGANGLACFDAVQLNDLSAFAQSIDRSWQLNRALDSGTDPPEVAQLVARVAPHAAALKLAGAGGGGFLYIIAHDAAAAATLRRELESDLPNPRARFFEMNVSTTGMKVTRS